MFGMAMSNFPARKSCRPAALTAGLFDGLFPFSGMKPTLKGAARHGKDAKSALSGGEDWKGRSPFDRGRGLDLIHRRNVRRTE